MKESRIVKGMDMSLETKEGTKVYVAKTYDKGTIKHGFKVAVLDKNLYCSEVVRFNRDADIGSKIKGMVNIADLTMKHINEVIKYINENFDSMNTIYSEDKINIREVFKAIYDEVNESEVKDGYYFINNKLFNEIILDCGWSVLAVKKILREAGMLKINNGRPYDYSAKINGVSVKHTCINALDLKLESDGVEVK